MLKYYLILFCFYSLQLNAKSAFDIMKKVEEQSQIVKNQNYEIFMLLTDAKGKKRERFFDLKKKISTTYSKSLVKFYKPANIKNTSLLSHSKLASSADPTQWLFLPSLRTVQQISSENKNNSFMGSDFTILDMAGRAAEKDEHQLIKEDEQYYFVKSTPKDKTDNYGYMVYLIAKDNYLPIMVEFYDQQKQLLKTLTNQKIKHEENMYFANISIMENKQTNSSTVIEILEYDFVSHISDNDVGIKSLQ